MLALALDERHQQVLARLDRGADRRQRAPHRAGNRIAALGAVQNNAGERRLEAQGYFGHRGLGRQAERLSLFPSTFATGGMSAVVATPGPSSGAI